MMSQLSCFEPIRSVDVAIHWGIKCGQEESPMGKTLKGKNWVNSQITGKKFWTPALNGWKNLNSLFVDFYENSHRIARFFSEKKRNFKFQKEISLPFLRFGVLGETETLCQKVIWNKFIWHETFNKAFGIH